MSRFFRQDSDSSSGFAHPPDTHESSDESSGSEGSQLGPNRDENDSDIDLNESYIHQPTLPVLVSLSPAVRSQQSHLSPKIPEALPAPLIQHILQTVPSLNLFDEEDLHLKFMWKRYRCDGIDIWLQAVDPDTGDGLVHTIVRAGNSAALGACRLHPTCGNGVSRFRGRRQRYMLFMHRNKEGSNALHIAACMDSSLSLPLVRAVLYMFRGRDPDDGMEIAGEFNRESGENGLADTKSMEPWDAEMILLIESTNKMGRTIVEEAPYHGRAETADFLEHVLCQMYPPGCVDRQNAKRLAKSTVNRYYWFRNEV